jgi:hypothetical protein
MDHQEANGGHCGAPDSFLKEPHDKADICQESRSDGETQSNVEDLWVCLIFDDF